MRIVELLNDLWPRFGSKCPKFLAQSKVTLFIDVYTHFTYCGRVQLPWQLLRTSFAGVNEWVLTKEVLVLSFYWQFLKQFLLFHGHDFNADKRRMSYLKMYYSFSSSLSTSSSLFYNEVHCLSQSLPLHCSVETLYNEVLRTRILLGGGGRIHVLGILLYQ